MSGPGAILLIADTLRFAWHPTPGT